MSRFSFVDPKRVFRYPRGAIIFMQGDVATRFYLLMEGIVRLSICGGQGQERIIDFLSPVCFFGAPDVLSGSSYGVTATAYTEVVAASFSADQVPSLMDNREFVQEMMRSLAEQTRSMGRRLVGDSFYSVSGKVAFALLNLGRLLGSGSNGEVVSLPITQNELARFAGCNRVTVTKVISHLASAGLIRRKKRRLFMCNQEGLRRWLEASGSS